MQCGKEHRHDGHRGRGHHRTHGGGGAGAGLPEKPIRPGLRGRAHGERAGQGQHPPGHVYAQRPEDCRERLHPGRLRPEGEVPGDHGGASERWGEGADRRPVRPAPGRAGLHHDRRGRLLPGRERRRAARRRQALLPHRRRAWHGRLHRRLSGRGRRAGGRAGHLRRRRIHVEGGAVRQAVQGRRHGEHVQLRPGPPQRPTGLSSGHHPATST